MNRLEKEILFVNNKRKSLKRKRNKWLSTFRKPLMTRKKELRLDNIECKLNQRKSKKLTLLQLLLKMKRKLVIEHLIKRS